MPRKILTGNHAVAEAVKLARVQVIAAYPITPQTTIVERLAEMAERGEIKAKMIRVESEHSALAAVYGAAAGGARAFTATSSHGLLYMHEVVWWAAASRLPLVMAVVTRAIGPPWNIHVSHEDIMDQRDTGWIISMAEDNQEVLDLVLQAFRISEDDRVYLPAMVGLDGFLLSHTAMPVDVPDQEDVDSWLPPRLPKPYTVEPGSGVIMGNIPPDEAFYMMRYAMQRAMYNAKRVIEEVDEEYYKVTGRRYGGLVEFYRCNDAKYVIVLMGTWAGNAKEAADRLREKGIPVGVARIRYVRPFPRERLRERLMGMKGVIVLDRSVSMGRGGPLHAEVAEALEAKPSMMGVVAGVGGVDVGVRDFEKLVESFVGKVEAEGRVYVNDYWYGV